MWRLTLAIVTVALGVSMLLLYLARSQRDAPPTAVVQPGSPVPTTAVPSPEKSSDSENAPNDSNTSPPATAPAPAPTTGPMMITIKQRRQTQQTSTRFTKMDFDGNPLPDDADSWHCAQSRETGLLWEVKRFDGGLRDNDHTYTWFAPGSGIAATTAGVEDGGECRFSSCDSHGYIEQINGLDLCGRDRWRLPTFAELDTLLDRDFYDPVINQRIFIHTRPGRYLTSTAMGGESPLVMYIDFFNGTSFGGRKNLDYHVRLVSDNPGKP